MPITKVTEESLLLINPELTARAITGYEFKIEKVKKSISFLPSVYEVKEFLKSKINEAGKALSSPEHSAILPLITGDDSSLKRMYESSQKIAKYSPALNFRGSLNDYETFSQMPHEALDEVFLAFMEQQIEHLDTLTLPTSMMMYPIMKILQEEELEKQVFAIAPNLIQVYFLNKYHEYLKAELRTYIQKNDDETTPFRTEPLPNGWVKINGKMTDEELWTFFSFLWKETCGEKDGESFMKEWEVRNLLQYGFAYPENPDPAFKLNISPKRKIGIIYNAFYWLFSEHQKTYKSNKSEFAKFLRHHFSDFESLDEKSVYSNIRNTKINSQNFEFAITKRPKAGK